jgi:hypothetical protein
MLRLMALLLPGLPALLLGIQPMQRGAGFVGEPSGTGPFPAVAEYRSDLPDHTIYRPTDLPGESLPLVVWGNGGCSNDGLAHAAYLRQVASQGYFVVSLGVPGGRPAPADSSTDPTEAGQMIEAIEWAKQLPPPTGPFRESVYVPGRDGTRLAMNIPRPAMDGGTRRP